MPLNDGNWRHTMPVIKGYGSRETLPEITKIWVLTHLPLDKMAAILADDIFRRIFVNEKFWTLIKNTLKFVAKVPIDNNPALV